MRLSFYTLLFVGVLLYCVDSALYDKKRGFQTYRVDPEEYLKQHNPFAQLKRQQTVKDLKDHPDVKNFLNWQKSRQAGAEDAAAAFVGNLPHDFIHHIGRQDFPGDAWENAFEEPVQTCVAGETCAESPV